MKDIHGHPLPALTSASTVADRYLAAILAELQWQRTQTTPPAAAAPVSKASRGNKVEEIRGPKAA